MENLTKVLKMIPEEEISKLLMFAQMRKKEPVVILNTVAITFFATTLKPTLKSYQTTYLNNGKKISGNMIRLKQIGKNPWKDGTHGMPDHLAVIFRSVDEDEINREILEYAYRLIDITLQDILENSKPSEAKKYLAALEQENFLYVMLQIAVRLVGLELKNRGKILENHTLDYMLEVLREEKTKLSQLFARCIVNGNIEVAINNYYSTLNNYLNDFENRIISTSGHQIRAIGAELSLLEDIGEETLFTFLGYLLGELQNKYQIQKQIFANKLITIR